VFRELAGDVALVAHGVRLPIGKVSPVDELYLEQVARRIDDLSGASIAALGPGNGREAKPNHNPTRMDAIYATCLEPSAKQLPIVDGRPGLGRTGRARGSSQ
jgi:hypothetical protein